MTKSSRESLDIKSILLIDDDEIFCNLLKTLIKKLFPQTRIVQHNPVTLGIPDNEFNWNEYDLLILDYDLGNNHNGIELLSDYIELDSFPPTIILTAHGNEDIAVKAIRFGAHDYINKQKLSIDRLGEAIRNVKANHNRRKKFTQSQSFQATFFNKVLFYKKLEKLINSYSPENLYFLLQIRIDNYREIYNQQGILGTDNYITEISESFAKNLSDHKIDYNITRIGDSSIAIVITNCSSTRDVENIAGLLFELKSDRFYKDNNTKTGSTLSIGIVKITGNTSLIELMEGAEEACKNASRNKGNSYYLASTLPAEEKSKENQKKIETAKKRSIDLVKLVNDNKIQSYYCPCIAISEAATSFDFKFFKVSAKLIDEDNNVLDYLDINDADIKKGHTGLLDRWLIRDAMGQALPLKKSNQKLNLGLFLSLSRPSVSSNELLEWMEKLIKKINVQGLSSCLIFEISPLDFISNKKQILGFINNMRDKWNVSFSLNNIVKADIVDICVKLGGFEYVSLVMDKSKKELLNEISQGCKKLGVLTLMYNINDADALTFAIDTGIDFGQGDFIQPAFEEILINNEVIEI
ncbi:MAG TPA: response regulator [Bacteroidales bacterium]|nr:response regulator [Bacteroidales bacterium]